MRIKLCRKVNIALAAIMCVSLAGCANSAESYETFEANVSSVSTLEPVDTVLNTVSYEGEVAEVETAEKTFSSDDGLCVIQQKPSYYEIYLDYSSGDYRAVGKAYGETVKNLDIDFAEVMEPYLYENVKMAFPNLNGDYAPVEIRIDNLMVNIPTEYREEMEGFAEALSGSDATSEDSGLKSDGIISYYEALLMQMVPDCLRGTNCNALSVWGDKTVTGKKINSRTLEWTLGSEYQMCTAHAVTHFNMGSGKNSFVTFGVIGMLDILTGINDKGVMAGILDVGSGIDYACEGKKCYTYELRYAMENMSDARTIAEHMVSESKNFTYSHNILITDEKDSFVAEDCVYKMEELTDEDRENKSNPFTAKSNLRDKDTPLQDGITWDNPDSLCVVNAFMSDGCDDVFSGSGNNYLRFYKFNEWVGEKDKLSVSDVKDIVTRETVDMESCFQKIHSESVFQTIIYDYSTNEVEVTFTGVEGVVNHPVFVKIETDF